MISPKKELGKLSQLSTARINEGEYDDLIKEGIRSLVYTIMQKSGGTENPTIVIERIGKVVESAYAKKRD